MHDPEVTLPPRDVVPPRPPTLDALAALNAAVGTEVAVTEAGELLTDVDGIPMAVGPATTHTAFMLPAYFMRYEVERLGGDPADYPNLRFLDTEENTP